MIFRARAKCERDYRAGQTITEKDAEELNDVATSIGDLVAKELIDRPIFEVSQKGVFNQKALLSLSEGKANNFFEQKVWDKLPQIARSDFSDTAKCLLFEASTPAAMVSLRGMEAVIREYYKIKIETNNEKKSLGIIIRELKSQNITSKILDYLDYLRSEKRNFAQHPDKIFSQKEAERIFMEIISMVHDIYAELAN